MVLPDEMRRLTRYFLDAYNIRMEAVVGIQTATEEELAQFHAARQAMAVEQQRQLGQYMSDLRGSVGGILLGAQTFVKDARDAHQAMANGQRERLAEDRDLLAEDRDRLASDTTALLEEFDYAHQAMAAEQQQQLGQYMSDLRGNVGGILLGAQTFVKDAHDAHQAMAAEQRDHLAEQRDRLAEDRDCLASDVATMRDKLGAEQGKSQAELNEARRVWSSFTTIMQQRRARKPTAPPPSPVEKAPPPPTVERVSPPVEKVPPDDLTAIRGIGANLQERLNNAGIHTFAQLATSTPEELRRALGTAGQLARVEEWIEQARELALG